MMMLMCRPMQMDGSQNPPLDYDEILNNFNFQMNADTARRQSFSTIDSAQTIYNTSYISRTESGSTNIVNNKIDNPLSVLSAEQYNAGLLMMQSNMTSHTSNMNNEATLSASSSMPWVGQTTIIEANQAWPASYVSLTQDHLDTTNQRRADLGLESFNYATVLERRPSEPVIKTRSSKRSSRTSITSGMIKPSRSKRSSLIVSRQSSEEKSESDQEDNKDEDDLDKRQRGRPRLDTKDETAIDRRRTQIRLAQRAYRQRKESTINSLKLRVQELETAFTSMTSLCYELQSTISTLQSRNDVHGLQDNLKTISDQISALAQKTAAGALTIDDNDPDDRHHSDKAKKRKTSIETFPHLTTQALSHPSNSDMNSTELGIGWLKKFTLGSSTAPSDKDVQSNESESRESTVGDQF